MYTTRVLTKKSISFYSKILLILKIKQMVVTFYMKHFVCIKNFF